MNLQEKTIKEPNFNKFLSSYIVDVLVFAAGNFICNFDICNHLHVMQTIQIEIFSG